MEQKMAEKKFDKKTEQWLMSLCTQALDLTRDEANNIVKMLEGFAKDRQELTANFDPKKAGQVETSINEIVSSIKVTPQGNLTIPEGERVKVFGHVSGLSLTGKLKTKKPMKEAVTTTYSLELGKKTYIIESKMPKKYIEQIVQQSTKTLADAIKEGEVKLVHWQSFGKTKKIGLADVGEFLSKLDGEKNRNKLKLKSM